MVSLLGYRIWEYFTVLFDTIPKTIYFYYAAVASALDALQCLMRRLAGLDVYYVGNNNTPVTGQDPASEFIMGILGLGDNAAAYKGLQTVFWSLAIFGLIVLAISTIIAIVKSHYQEDASKTNPLTHIYTAIKALLTFAIVPIVVIVGFLLANFTLRTLDNIVTGSATAESLEGIYGDGYVDVFEPAKSEVDRGKEYYSRYDVFSAGMVSTTTTFSGLIFRTCAHSANRIRTESFDYTQGVTGTSWSDSAFYNFGLFGEPSSFPSDVTDSKDKQEWTAYQIDYAFQNNLKLKKDVWAETLYAASPGTLVISFLDPYALYSGVGSFSKYNVGLVWYYYNLWQFNFVIGFVAVVTCFTLMINIIFGLISRIIKSAALFLIYPAILGLNPLDSGAAFKKWREEFMPQILMTFGGIIGMNLLFLLFPYVDNIHFFGFWPLDGMVNILVITAGLVMIKQFIKFISGLVGGADANEIGGEVRKESIAALKKGTSLATAPIQVASMFVPGVMGLKGLATAARAKGAQAAFNKAGKAAGMAGTKAEKLAYDAGQEVETAKKTQKALRENYQGQNGESLDTQAMNELREQYGKEADSLGMKGFARSKYINEHMSTEELESKRKEIMMRNAEYARNEQIIAEGGFTAAQKEEYDKYKAAEGEATARQKKIKDVWGFDGELKPRTAKDGTAYNALEARGAREWAKATDKKLGEDMEKEFSQLGPRIAKVFGTAFTQALNLDDIKGVIGSALQSFDNKKYDSEGKEVGKYETAGLGSTWHSVKDSFLGISAPKEEKKSESDKLSASADTMSSTASRLDQAADKILKAAEKLERAGGRH